jgi:hypothetical protein
MPVRQLIEGGRVPVKVFTGDLEPHSRQRLASSAAVHTLKQVLCVKG